MNNSSVSEKYLTLAQATHHIPGRPALPTLKRWAYTGYKGVRLQTWKCGRQRCTTQAAIEQFIYDTTAAENGEAVSDSHLCAEKTLDQLGV